MPRSLPIGSLQFESAVFTQKSSLSSVNGDGLAFVILPRGNSLDGQWFGLSSTKGSVCRIPNLFAVEFDSSQNKEVMDINASHVGFDIESLISSKTADVSEMELILNDGTQLHAWIDYDARSKVLEVRLSKSGLIRPSAPLISHSVDLSGLWKDEMYVGISSSSGDSSQNNVVYSWSFTSSPFHRPQHSHPVNPQAFSQNRRNSFHRRANDILDIFVALLFGTGCGAMAAALTMFLVWSLFTSRFGSTSTEFAAHPADFGYEKISVTDSNDGFDNNIK